MLDVDQVATEAEELAQVLAGYNNTRAEPAPVETEQVEVVAAPPEVSMTGLADELRELKARVSASQADPDAVRKMHGEIGNINRTLLKLQTPPPAPVVDEEAAELDAIVEEYPEVVGPIVKALRAQQAKLQQQSSQPPDDIDARVSATVTRLRQSDAVEALKEEHPDYETVRDTPAYHSWLASKPTDFQTRFTTTWNPSVVARGLSEFKESIRRQEVKQTRLASAITPQGVPHRAGSSALSDDEALWAGYNKGHKRLK